MARRSASHGEFFGGGEVGVARGPGMVTVKATQFFIDSQIPFKIYSATDPNQIAQVNMFQLENKGDFLFSFTIGYNFNDYIGVYFDYIDWGDQDIYSINSQNASTLAPGFKGTLSGTSFGPGFIGYWPLGKGLFNFYGSVGVEFLNSDLKFTSPSCKPGTCNNPFNPGSYSIGTNETVSLLYAVGGQINLGEYFAIRLAYRALARLSDSEIANINYGSYIVGVYARISI